jgi:hypothetical protein
MTAATELRRLPVPDTLPPLDTDDLTSCRAAHRLGPDDGRDPGPVQGVLTLVLGGQAEPELDFGPVPTRRADLPEPLGWSRRLVQVVVEVMAGQRAATQLLRWTTPAVYDLVRAYTLPRPRPGQRPVRGRPHVVSVRVCEPADGVAEVSAVVRGRYRTQALALRLEGRDGRWRVTALETA